MDCLPQNASDYSSNCYRDRIIENCEPLPSKTVLGGGRMAGGSRMTSNTTNEDTLDHCMKAYNHGPYSRMSITFNSSKGLTNAPGQNNCFLNSAVQVLWHLDAFRRSFRLLSGHSCMGNACIFCALKVMFTQFQYSDKAVLPPDALRQAMAETFANQQRFQMGLMDDAAECFENMLMRIHTHIAPEENEDTCQAPHCLPHQKFSMSVSELVSCASCGARSDPFTFNEMVFYVSTGALVAEHKSTTGGGTEPVSFSNLLKNTVSKGDVRSCPDNCGQFGVKERNLQNTPDVVSIGLVWESAKSGGQHIRDVVNCIGQTLSLDELFHSTPASKLHESSTPLHLVGVVCYYGKHYSTFFFHSKVQEWFYFDDAAVKQISSGWSKVCEKLCKGRHQPLLLLYMNPRTQAVDVSSALKFRTMAPGYEWKNDDVVDPKLELSPELRPADDYDMVSSNRAYTSAPNQSSNYSHHRRGEMEIGKAGLLSHTAADRQDSGFSSGLSRQDSGVSSRSSRSTTYDLDTVSHISAVTKHSSDSSSSGVKDCDGALSYSSKASTAGSSVADQDDVYYTASNKTYIRRNLSNNETSTSSSLSPSRSDMEDTKRDKPKVLMKKKKGKNETSSRLSADVVRYHSKSQADLSVSEPYEETKSGPVASYSQESSDQKSISYATLPRKKRATSSNSCPAPVKTPEANQDWIRENMKDSTDAVPSIGSRIKMFNNISDKLDSESTSAKPPEIKPLLQPSTTAVSSGSETGGPSYINRTSVEKILLQQRRASRGAVTSKMVRPTYDEQFSLPDEFIVDQEKKVELKFDMADNTSLGSLKDSGYRSLGDRGSNSASSISSVSAESPTMNNSFTFDTREHIYCEPPPISSETTTYPQSGLLAQQVSPVAESEFDFPPPPSELELNGGHTKQLSEASLLSDASTVKLRKSPSLDESDSTTSVEKSLTDGNSAKWASCEDKLRDLSVSDSKLQSMVNTADSYIGRAQEQELRNDLGNALIYCQQAISLLSSVSSLRPSDLNLEQTVQAKLDYCLKQSDGLHSKINRPPSNTNKVERRLMGELHIDNQTKRESASSDYTPLHSAINRAPSRKSQEGDNYGHRLSRTSSSSSMGSKTSEHTEQIAKPVERTNGFTRTSSSNYQHLPPKTKPVLAQRTSNTGTYKEVTIPTTLQRHGYIRDGCNRQNAYDRSVDCATPVIPPPKEFSELSSQDSTNAADQAAQIHLTEQMHSQYNHYQPTSTSRPAPSAATNIINTSTNHSSISNRVSAPPTANHHTNQREAVALPPKQTINKQGIRDLLVKDMLKRQGHEVTATNHNQTYNRPYTTQQPLPAAYQPSSRLYEPQLPARQHTTHSTKPQYEPPLWTPPQKSAYDRGLSHYDSPAYQNRHNNVGRVNAVNPYSNGNTNGTTHQPNNPSHNSIYPRTNHRTFQQEGHNSKPPQHCHQYSTEL